MGKTKRSVSTASPTASNGDNDGLRNIVIAAMTDEHVISTIADRIGELEASVSRMEERVDQQEQYSRRTSIRVSVIKEPVGLQGEGVSKIGENADLPSLTLADVNVAHRVGQRGNPNEPKTRPRTISSA